MFEWKEMNDKNVSKCLEKFIGKTECTNEWLTQFNESLNRTKSKYGNKDVKWWNSPNGKNSKKIHIHFDKI
jgi:hypothetical protein